MFCPQCGLEHIEARRFCSRCGTNLENVTRVLTGEMDDPKIAETLEKRRRSLSRGFLVFCSGPLFGLLTVIVAEIMRGAFPPERYGFGFGFRYPPIVYIIENFGFFGFFLSLLGVVMMLNTLLVYGRKKHLLRSVATPNQPTAELSERSLTKLPGKVPSATTYSPPSVVENTTYRLEPKTSAIGLSSPSTEESILNPAHRTRSKTRQ